MKLRTYLAALALSSLTAGSALAAPNQGVVRDHRTRDTVVTRDHRAPVPSVKVPSARPRIEIPIVTSYAPASGPAGTSVTIYGDNFVDGTKVVYGGIAITPSYLGDSKIVFQVPVRAVDASISLDQPGRGRTLAVGEFDVRTPVVVPPRPRVEPPSPRVEQPSRSSRRARSVASYRARWQAAFLASPKTRAELRLHSQRIAKLERMMRLAKAEPRKNARLIVRIDALISKENKRHDKAMSRLEASFKLD